MPIEVRRALYLGNYERAERRAIEANLRPGDVVMELGTGLGFLAVYAARVVGSNRVFTYEANPGLEAYIRSVFALNGVRPSLQMCVLGEQPGETSFFVEKAFWWSSTVRSDKATEVRVPVKRFNDEIARIDPTFLTIDIEGGEYDLVGFADFHRTRKLVIELHPTILGPEKVASVDVGLARAGFRADREFCSGDTLFLRREECP